MLLTLDRLIYSRQSTIGHLAVDGVYLWNTLEPQVVDGLPGSAIPPGTYEIQLAPSPRFLAEAANESLDPIYRQFVAKYANQMPHIAGIPKRSLIMLHWGDFPKETDGCVLVGKTHGTDCIGESRNGFSEIFSYIEAPAKARNCAIRVVAHTIPFPADLSLEGDC